MERKTFYLFANPFQAAGCEAAARACALLIKANARVFCEPWLAQTLLGAESAPLSSLSAQTDALIALGGDGTLLRAAPEAAKAGVPMLGIHTGTIGFLMETDLAALEQTMDALLAARYTLEERTLLACALNGGAPALALNDCSVTRGENPGVLSVSVFADGEKIYDLTGDGALVSTPTGATAYALAAGAPILRPDVPCLLVTPLCARELLAKPVLLPQSARLSLLVRADARRKPQLSLDGQKVSSIVSDAEISIVLAPERARFIRFEKRSFFDQLRVKQARWNHL